MNKNRLQLKYRLSDRMDNTHVYRSERNRGSRPANHPSTSTKRNVAIIFLREILEEWKPCFPDKLKHSNDRTKDWWISDRTFKIRNADWNWYEQVKFTSGYCYGKRERSQFGCKQQNSSNSYIYVFPMTGLIKHLQEDLRNCFMQVKNKSCSSCLTQEFPVMDSLLSEIDVLSWVTRSVNQSPIQTHKMPKRMFI